MAILLLAPVVLAKPFAYIPSSSDNVVTIVDTATNSPVSSLSVGAYPQGVAVSADGSRVYVSCYEGLSVAVIDGTTRQQIASISLPFRPYGIAVNPDGRHIYVGDGQANGFAVIDAGTHQLTTTLTLPGSSRGIAVAPAGRYVFVAHFANDSISLIDTLTNSHVASIPVGSGPTGIAVSPDGQRVYVANQVDGSMSVIDTSTRSEVARIPLGGSPYGIAVSPEGQQVYLSDLAGDRVLIVDPWQERITATIALPVNASPRGLDLSVDGGTLYVADLGTGTLSVIDLAGQTVTAGITVGGSPYALGDFLPPGRGDRWQPIAAGGEYNLVLLADGSVLSWGRNTYGQLGDGTTVDRHTPAPVLDGGGLPLTGIRAVAAGLDHSLALTEDGRVLAWGGNAHGQLGDGSRVNHPKPTPVTDAAGTPLTEVVAIAAGYGHSLALRRDGSLFAWGGNWMGQLGDGGTTEQLNPVPVVDAAGTPLTDVVAIACGYYHSMALLRSGGLLTWGRNDSGQLGNRSYADSSYPQLISFSPAPVGGLVAIAAGANHSLALDAGGTVWAWGSNSAGQLGLPPGSNLSWPDRVPNPLASGRVVAIAAGRDHSLALRDDGRLQSWGWNYYGQLGDGTTQDRYNLDLVRDANGLPLTGLLAVAAGDGHSLGVAGDGSVLAWGRNSNGQLGNGGIGMTETRPVSVVDAGGAPLLLLENGSGSSPVCPVPVQTGPNSQLSPAGNALGEVVWSEFDPATGRRQIFSSTRGRLTTDDADHSSPAINLYGDVVWERNDPNSFQSSIEGLFGGVAGQIVINGSQPALNDAGEVVFIGGDNEIWSTLRGRLTSDGVSKRQPDLNNNGDVVWSQNGEIYLLAAGATAPVAVSGSNGGDAPSISDSGEIVFGRYDGSGVRLYSTLRGQLTGVCPLATDHVDPDINSCGDVVFTSMNSSGPSRVYRLGDGAPCVQPPAEQSVCEVAGSPVLVEPGHEIPSGGDINDRGERVWSEFDPAGGYFQVFSSLRGQLTFDAADHNRPSINNSGDVVWERYDPTYNQSLVEGLINGELTFVAQDGEHPAINDHNEVVYLGYPDKEIYSSRRGQLTHDGIFKMAPDLNNRGDVVWSQNGDIYLLAFGSKKPVPVANGSQGNAPSINDAGEIVFERYTNSGTRLYSNQRGLLTGGCPLAGDQREAGLNNCGDVIFSAMNAGPSRLYQLGEESPCMARPVAEFSVASVENPGQGLGYCDSLAFDGSGSYHAAAGRTLVSWDWDINDDGTVEMTGEVPAPMSLNVEGNVVVRLTVTDDQGETDSNLVQLTLVNRPPVIDAGGPYTLATGQDLRLDAGASYDLDPCSAYDYAWDIDGDGLYDDATGMTPTVPWSRLASLPVGVPVGISVRATDTAGGTEFYASTTVVVATPVAGVSFTVLPASTQVVGQLVTVMASSTGGGAQVEYQLWVYDYDGASSSW
ncbi:beta-propeller fold lactonase family protein, partial [Geothermobacter hydrogeniphilus]